MFIILYINYNYVIVSLSILGYGGFINSFLSWGFFKPLARMNYIVYLIHEGLITTVYSSLTYTVEFTDIVAVRTILCIT